MNPETLPLHLLRPHALWLLCALPLAWAWLRRRRRPDDAWQASIDPHLRPHVLETSSPRVRGAARWPRCAPIWQTGFAPFRACRRAMR